MGICLYFDRWNGYNGIMLKSTRTKRSKIRLTSPKAAHCDFCLSPFTSYLHPNGNRTKYCSPKHNQYARQGRTIKKEQAKFPGALSRAMIDKAIPPEETK